MIVDILGQKPKFGASKEPPQCRHSDFHLEFPLRRRRCKQMASHQLQDISFRPITRDDLALIHQWILRPHVAEWWQSPRSIADVEEHYLPSINGTSTTKAFVAQRGQEPIGFIQSYVVMGSGDGWWENEQDPGARGVDQFLANPHQLNHGLGTAMVRAFLTMIFGDPEVTIVQADPDPNNHRAIRCYTKAGFAAVGQVVTPDGMALLMRCSRAALPVCAGAPSGHSPTAE
jgi:RimJ/RimL family protein N-acetyltransferase